MDHRVRAVVRSGASWLPDVANTGCCHRRDRLEPTETFANVPGRCMDPSHESPHTAPSGFEELREPSPDFIERVLAVVESILPGRVMAYGDVATAVGPHDDLAGTTGSYGARLVGNVMARFGEGVPWWRVIRSTGHPPRYHEARALAFYQAEGTPLIGSDDAYRVDVRRARYDPDEPSPTQASLDLF